MEHFKRNLQLQATPRGQGVFCKVGVPAGMRIFEFSGDVLTTEQLSTRHSSDVADFLQIGQALWKTKSGTFDDYIQHSCNPNCYVWIVGQRAILTTLFEIKPGMELTYDWSVSSTETKEQWSMICSCGAYDCRKVISGWQYLPVSLQETYKAMGIVPTYQTVG
jgi:SET domain-containing protein